MNPPATERDDAPRYWTYAEITLIRAAALIHLVGMAVGLIVPTKLTVPFGIIVGEPATFLRASFAIYGVIGVGLLRVVNVERPRGRLLVETVGLAKIALFAVFVADVVARRQPATAAIALLGELAFGVALFRASRRVQRTR